MTVAVGEGKAISSQQCVLSSQMHSATGQHRDMLFRITEKQPVSGELTVNPVVHLTFLSIIFANNLKGFSQIIFRYHYSSNNEQKWQGSSKNVSQVVNSEYWLHNKC